MLEILYRHLKLLEQEKDEVEYLISRNNLRRHEYERQFNELANGIENIKRTIQEEREKNE